MTTNRTPIFVLCEGNSDELNNMSRELVETAGANLSVNDGISIITFSHPTYHPRNISYVFADMDNPNMEIIRAKCPVRIVPVSLHNVTSETIETLIDHDDGKMGVTPSYIIAILNEEKVDADIPWEALLALPNVETVVILDDPNELSRVTTDVMSFPLRTLYTDTAPIALSERGERALTTLWRVAIEETLDECNIKTERELAVFAEQGSHDILGREALRGLLTKHISSESLLPNMELYLPALIATSREVFGDLRNSNSVAELTEAGRAEISRIFDRIVESSPPNQSGGDEESPQTIAATTVPLQMPMIDSLMAMSSLALITGAEGRMSKNGLIDWMRLLLVLRMDLAVAAILALVPGPVAEVVTRCVQLVPLAPPSDGTERAMRTVYIALAVRDHGEEDGVSLRENILAVDTDDVQRRLLHISSSTVSHVDIIRRDLMADVVLVPPKKLFEFLPLASISGRVVIANSTKSREELELPGSIPVVDISAPAAGKAILGYLRPDVYGTLLEKQRQDSRSPVLKEAAAKKYAAHIQATNQLSATIDQEKRERALEQEKQEPQQPQRLWGDRFRAYAPAVFIGAVGLGMIVARAVVGKRRKDIRPKDN